MLLPGTLIFALAGLAVLPAVADGPQLQAKFGLGGIYRPGGWIPVSVTVTNRTAGPLQGQLQISPSELPGTPGSQKSDSAIFARPVTIAPSATPQVVNLFARDLDPSRDDVQVAWKEGFVRGDGQTLTNISSLTDTKSGSVLGVPVPEQDLLLVAFSGEPFAFNALNGQKWNLQHAPGAPVDPPAVPSEPRLEPVVHVGTMLSAELPDKAAGYSGVDAFLLRSDAPLDSLTEAQSDTLKGWVASGGHLIVCGGADATRFGNPFFSAFLPAHVTESNRSITQPGVGTVTPLRLTVDPGAATRVLKRGPDGQPLIVAAPYGAGTIVLTAYDLTTPAFRAWRGPDEVAFWRTLLTAGGTRPVSLLSYVADREQNSRQSYDWGGLQLSDAVLHGHALKAPPAELVGLFLIVYLLLLVPVNYLVLKRLDRKEWSWVTIPALSLIFAAGTYGVGYAAKGGATLLNQAAIIETSAGSSHAGMYSEFGLFSAHRTTYEMTLAEPSGLMTYPNSTQDGRNAGQAQAYGATRFIETADDVKVQDAAVNMWAMRTFDVQTTLELNGQIDGNVTRDSSGLKLSGSVTNHLHTALTDCALYYHGQWTTLGNLAVGQTVPCAMALNGMPADMASGNGENFQVPTGGSIQAGPSESSSQNPIRAATADFVRSLGNSQFYNQYNGGNAQSLPAYRPHGSEAVLIGWSSDSSLAGSSISVNGVSPSSKSAVMLAIHLPVTRGGAR